MSTPSVVDIVKRKAKSNIALIACTKCGKTYPNVYPKCPYCQATNVNQLT